MKSTQAKSYSRSGNKSCLGLLKNELHLNGFCYFSRNVSIEGGGGDCEQEISLAWSSSVICPSWQVSRTCVPKTPRGKNSRADEEILFVWCSSTPQPFAHSSHLPLLSRWHYLALAHKLRDRRWQIYRDEHVFHEVVYLTLSGNDGGGI